MIVQSNVLSDEMEARRQTVLEKCSKLNISVSLGIEFIKHQDETVSQIMHRADLKMYEAKKEYYMEVGRDRREKGRVNYENCI